MVDEDEPSNTPVSGVRRRMNKGEATPLPQESDGG